MKILVDMNLSPDWVAVLQRHGWDAVHWSSTGDPRASDRELMDWARANDYVVFTHDLDFGMLLANLIRVRSQDVLPSAIGDMVVRPIRAAEPHLKAGALVTVGSFRHRIRLLPI